MVSDFQIGDDFVAFEIAERITQLGFAQTALRCRGQVRRTGCRAIGRERVLLAAESLVKPAGKDRDRRSQILWYADGLQVIQLVLGAGEVANLDR